MTTLAVEVGIDTLRAGRSIRVTARFARSIARDLGADGRGLVSEPSSTAGWVVLRLSQDPEYRHVCRDCDLKAVGR